MNTWGSTPFHCDLCSATLEWPKWRYLLAHGIPMISASQVVNLLMRRGYSDVLDIAAAIVVWVGLSLVCWPAFLRLRVKPDKSRPLEPV